MNEKEFYYNRKTGIYLDSACSALKMRCGIEAFEEVCRWGGCGGKRTTHIFSQRVEEYFKKARATIASFLNAKENEIVFTSGTTDGFNRLASSIPIKEGEKIIISALEHNSVFLPFYERAQKEKARLVIIPLKDFKPDFEFFKKAVNKKTAVVSLTMASNIFGGSLDLKRFITFTREKAPQALILLDAAQYITSHKVDVKEIDCDALCFSGHKLGAPYGIGVMYIKEEAMKKLKIRYRGGGTVKEVKLCGKKIEVDYLDGYYGFEAGIQNYSGAYALSKVIERLDEISYQRIRTHIRGLVEYAYQRLSEIDEIKIVGDNITEGSIISFKPKNKRFLVKDFEIFASQQKPPIAFRTGRMCADLACIASGIKEVIRISFFIYNSKDDVDIFLETLRDYLRSL